MEDVNPETEMFVLSEDSMLVLYTKQLSVSLSWCSHLQWKATNASGEQGLWTENKFKVIQVAEQK